MSVPHHRYFRAHSAEKIIWILAVSLILLPVPSSGFWNIPNLFKNCHLTLFTAHGNARIPNADYFSPPYFNDLLSSNPSTPIILTQIHFGPNTVGILNQGNTTTGVHFYSKMTSLVTVLHMDSKEYEIDEPYTRLRGAIFKSSNPLFLFQHCDESLSPSDYDSLYINSGTGSLVLFHWRIPNKVLIPCILCDPSQIPEEYHIGGEGFTLSEISRVWVRINSNLHQKGVAIPGSNLLIEGNQCETKNLDAKVSNLNSCTLISLSKIFNFSKSNYQRGETFVYFFRVDWIFLEYTGFSIPYHVRHEMVQYMFVTSFPTPFNGINVSVPFR